MATTTFVPRGSAPAPNQIKSVFVASIYIFSNALLLPTPEVQDCDGVEQPDDGQRWFGREAAVTQISSCSVLVSAAAVGRAVRSGAPEKLHFLAHGGRRLVGALSPDSRPPHSTTLSKGATSQPKPPDHFHSGALILLLSHVSLGPNRAEIGQSRPFKGRPMSTLPCPSLVLLPSNSLPLLSSVWRHAKNNKWVDAQ